MLQVSTSATGRSVPARLAEPAAAGGRMFARASPFSAQAFVFPSLSIIGFFSRILFVSFLPLSSDIRASRVPRLTSAQRPVSLWKVKILEDRKSLFILGLRNQDFPHWKVPESKLAIQDANICWLQPSPPSGMALEPLKGPGEMREIAGNCLSQTP